MKRSNFEMSLEVLEIIEKNNVPTRIMFTANMSWNRFMGIITGLKSVGLVKETILKRIATPGRMVSYNDEEDVWKTDKRVQRRYSLTEKGMKVLGLVKNLNSLIEGLDYEAEQELIPAE